MAPDGRLASLRSELTVFYWFFYRNLVQQFSFRSWFVMRILGLIISVTTFSIFAQVVPAAPHEEPQCQRHRRHQQQAQLTRAPQRGRRVRGRRIRSGGGAAPAQRE